MRTLYGLYGRAVTVIGTAVSLFILPNAVRSQSWASGSGGAIYYNGGNVGIGSTSPIAPLDVSDGIYHLWINSRSSADSGLFAGTDIASWNNVLNLAGDIQNGSPNGGVNIGYYSPSFGWTPALGIRNAPSGYSNLLLMQHGGNVGIGTATPSQLLEVSGPSEPLIRVTNTGMSGSPFLLMGMNAGNNAALFQVTSGKDFKFYNGQLALTILGSNGNVGIGTMSPAYPLAVNGTVRAKEIVVDTGWSDYVFNADYHLKPLTEVAAFIEQNHHLPDIPSEAEVKEKGVSLGDMQAKLLAKIEELTLQMIQLNEKNRQLEQRLVQVEAH